jgi:hypothetical protein
MRPDGTCSTGSDIETVRFRLEFCKCEEGRNTQGGDCVDEDTLPPSGETVRITCADGDDTLLFSSNVMEGDDVTITGDGALPDAVTCSIFSTGGDLLQSFTIDTSGDTDLFLKDKFGSFTLESCDAQDCIMEVTYTFEAENTGSVPIEVTSFDRTRSGEQVDLLTELESTDIAPGESVSASETESIDTCVGSEYFTTLDMVAVSPDGLECPDEADYFFVTPASCRVEVEIACTAEDGVECSEIESNPEDCGEVEVCYEYEITNVGTSDMDITKIERIRNEETTSLMDLLTVTTLAPGESTTVIECETIDTCSGGEFCTEITTEADPPNDETCASEDTYCFDIVPSTPSPTESPVPPPTPPPVPAPTEPPVPAPTEPPAPAPTEPPAPAPTDPPAPAPTEPPAPASTEPPTLPPTPSPSLAPTPPPVEPVCEFEMQIECVPPVGSTSCNATPPPVEQCTGRPFEMGFLYTGGDCSNSWNVQGLCCIPQCVRPELSVFHQSPS